MYGIILNVILVVTLILAGTHKNFIMKIAIPIINFVSKIHIGKVQLIKNKEERIEKFDASVTNFSEQFTKMRKEKKIIWMMMVGHCLEMKTVIIILLKVLKIKKHQAQI